MNKDYSEDENNLYINEQNKKKLKNLKDKYGILDGFTSQEASPELLNIFYDNIEKFEEVYENAEQKKIIEILGYPEFKAVNDLKPEELLLELDNVLALYSKFNMNIDVIEKDDVSDDVFYRFLVEELPQYETDAFQIEGFTANFIYEEFHPSNKLNAKDAVNGFIYSWFQKESIENFIWINKDKLRFNNDIVPSEKAVDLLFKEIPENVIKKEIIFKRFNFESKYISEIDLIIEYGNNQKAASDVNVKILNVEFELVDCEFGGLEICGIRLK